MAAVAVTAANVIAGSNCKYKVGWIGATTVTAGQSLYESNGLLYLADANASKAAASVVGIALTGGGVGQPCVYAYKDDDFTPGGTLTVQTGTGKGIVALSSTAGGIEMIDTALAAGAYPCLLGVAKSTTKMILDIVLPGDGVTT